MVPENLLNLVELFAAVPANDKFNFTWLSLPEAEREVIMKHVCTLLDQRSGNVTRNREKKNGIVSQRWRQSTLRRTANGKFSSTRKTKGKRQVFTLVMPQPSSSNAPSSSSINKQLLMPPTSKKRLLLDNNNDEDQTPVLESGQMTLDIFLKKRPKII